MSRFLTPSDEQLLARVRFFRLVERLIETHGRLYVATLLDRVMEELAEATPAQ